MKTTEEIMELATILGDRCLLATHGINSKDDVAAAYEELKSAIEELVKDAARYQWISAYLPSMDESHDDALVSAGSKEQIDAVVDAAMKAIP